MEIKTNFWCRNYPVGVPQEINSYQYTTIIDQFEQSVLRYGPLPAYDCMGASITYDELDMLSRNFAAYLQNYLGLKKGSRVAIQLPNIIQYPIALFGILRAGMVVVNTNPLYTAREMKHQFEDSGVEAIIILANFAHNLEQILPETIIEHIIITEMGDMLGGLKKHLVNGTVKYIKKLVPKYHIPKAVSFDSVIEKGYQRTLRPVNIRPDDIAFIQYTGGTTGVSKGAKLSHKNIVANVEQFDVWVGDSLSKGEEIIISVLPLSHILALTTNILTMMKVGGRCVLIPNPRDFNSFIKELKRYKFTIFSGVNTLFKALLNHPDFDSVGFSSLKITATGGMAVQQSVAERWKKKTGVPIVEGYGMTETSPVLTFNSMVAGEERLGTIGVPLPSTTIIIANNEGQEVPFGEPGEIYAKGPQIMEGYWNRPEETENAFTKDGWFKTGDIGVMDKHGFIKLVDRKKEMILVSGYNVYPSEIEEVVSSHQKVTEVGAIGVPSEKSGEVVKIYVVKKDQSLSKEELIAHCKQNLAPYKVPKHIEFRDELPKTNVGKILRRKLKEECLK
ncbi:AMP-binding protein [Chondrinema litorale]|uniref:AMP-binding protein n=1 Tax=Chondrinema litorale TaxID=2994555 RepID=UPI00254362E0|nr:AMP-binding protein [Chondrinema litorale]UZR96482.1 AMP-binding protein [Chondrinema litorale]